MKPFILIVGFAFVLFSCKKEPVITAVPFPEDLSGWIREKPGSRNLVISFATIKEFECAGYTITNTFSITGNNINFNFTGITAPGICFTIVNPATTEIDLGTLANNNYNLSFDFGDTIINGSLAISADDYVVTVPVQNKIQFSKPDINKIPPHTIFGDMEIGTGMEAAAQQFIDSLQISGATPANYLPGIYSRFEIDSNGQIIQEDVNWFKKFIYNFDGDPVVMHNLYERFRLAYPNGLAINLNTSYY